MRSLGLRVLLFVAVALAAFSVVGSVTAHQSNSTAGSGAGGSACPKDDSGLKLPPGFCATVFADGIGHARHLVVAPNGVVYVNTWSGLTIYGNETPHEGGFLVALQDKTGSGKAEVIERFGETAKTGAAGGTGIALYNGSIYAEINDRIVRYSLPAGALVPPGPADHRGFRAASRGRPSHASVFHQCEGILYMDVGTATNSCQLKNRTLQSPGAQPCTELETRGGIWRYDAKKTNQKFSPADRYATGIRNAEGFGVDPAGHRVFVTQHGRDQLHANWPDLYKPEEEATLPAEEVMLLKQGGDYGWPECYYDQVRESWFWRRNTEETAVMRSGVCASKIGPVAAFPAHWAPNGMVFYDQKQFPARYRNGVFIAFHGSWDRAPYPQGGYNIVFQSLAGDRSSGGCEIFADGFAGAVKSPEGAVYRPSGVAVGPDGSLYVADDMSGRIYKITYTGPAGAEAGNAGVTPCPSLSARPARSSRPMPSRPREPILMRGGFQPSGSSWRDARHGCAGRSHLPRASGRSDVHGLPWRERDRDSAGSRPDKK